MKNDANVQYLQKVLSKKAKEKNIFDGILKATGENSRIGIRIR
jgi:hypothetical protein